MKKSNDTPDIIFAQEMENLNAGIKIFKYVFYVFTVVIILLMTCGCTDKKVTDKNIHESAKTVVNTDNMAEPKKSNREMEDSEMNEMWEAYALIAERYIQSQNEFRKSGVLPDDELNSLYFTPDGTVMDKNELQTFLVYDINSDGIPEFFISRYIPELKKNEVYDAYTWKDGIAYRFMDDIEIGYRSGTCDIRENGVILSFYSGSAWDYGFVVMSFPQNGKDIERIEKLYAAQSKDENGNPQSIFLKRNLKEMSQPEIITEEEYIAYRDSFVLPDLNFLENNEGNTEHLRNGKIKY